MRGEDGKGVEGRGVDGRSVVRTGVGVGAPSVISPDSPFATSAASASFFPQPNSIRRASSSSPSARAARQRLVACAKHPDVARMLRSCDSMIRRPRPRCSNDHRWHAKGEAPCSRAIKETPLNTLADAHLAFGVTHRVERARAA